jgi:hypothetical protein
MIIGIVEANKEMLVVGGWMGILVDIKNGYRNVAIYWWSWVAHRRSGLRDLQGGPSTKDQDGDPDK